MLKYLLLVLSLIPSLAHSDDSKVFGSWTGKGFVIDEEGQRSKCSKISIKLVKDFDQLNLARQVLHCEQTNYTQENSVWLYIDGEKLLDRNRTPVGSIDDLSTAFTMPTGWEESWYLNVTSHDEMDFVFSMVTPSGKFNYKFQGTLHRE
jgi:hypothetical protein